MDNERILKNVGRHIALNDAENSFFLSLLVFKEVPKKACILTEGQACRQLSFVHAGALRSYCLDKEGKESTIMFAVSDWWLTDMYCYLNEQPAMMYITAIEDSQVFQLSRENFNKLLDAVPKFERFFRILMQNAYTREQLRIIENLTLTAQDRYERFLTKYPQIAAQVTQKQIASYLGITPEFLSTIRKNRSGRRIT